MKDLVVESNRCYLCKNPKCKANCPIDTPIPEIIELFKDGQIAKAGEILFKNNPLSLVCSIVCPHEDQCTGNCIRGIKDESVRFCDIETHISKYYLENVRLEKEAELDERVAIIGGGPAGITIAFILAQKGYKVTLFDSHDKIGGVLRYGIPEFRLPKSIIDHYEERLIELGVKIRPNTLVGPVLTLDKLFYDGYKAIFIGTGVWNPKTLDIKGESLGHVHYAIDYLKSPGVHKLGNRVCVIGAGDVAMDAARTAKRNGAKEVYILYRKGMENIPATKAELEGAISDGVKFELFKSPLELTDDGVKYIETENVTGDDGRINTVVIEGKEGLFECDSIIIAVSQSPKNNIVSNTSGLETNKWGLLLTDEYGHTTREGVFASGDVVTGAKTVVRAASHAKVVAEEIEKYIIQKKN
ncbi:MAG: NAD(P)-dependent oxidoreductase [Clostridium sp.]|uniref:NAD(P)-dependent oxidoreductase n=1 Tax=Clostridium sp. TaxID=1506 RepID=UPI0025B8FCEB|nr:NAD(P)-dependent oxidoreductase [Clostridium sp.]MCF0148021.1 NAD(P)-dependent oxidoreductase [Clostridium sp.]